jgi:hypothetical protein
VAGISGVDWELTRDILALTITPSQSQSHAPSPASRGKPFDLIQILRIFHMMIEYFTSLTVKAPDKRGVNTLFAKAIIVIICLACMVLMSSPAMAERESDLDGERDSTYGQSSRQVQESTADGSDKVELSKSKKQTRRTRSRRDD